MQLNIIPSIPNTPNNDDKEPVTDGSRPSYDRPGYDRPRYVRPGYDQ